MRLFTVLVIVLITGSSLKAQNISAKIDGYLSKPRKHEVFNGTVLVAQNGKIILHKAYGLRDVNTSVPNDTNTIFRIGSMTKAFTSTIILQLVEQHKLKLIDPISQYLPGYPSGDSISIEHLLTHQSGVKEYLLIESIQNTPDSAPPISLDSVIGTFRKEPLVMRPGKKFSYSNSNYILLAAIAYKITGKHIERLIREEILIPAGMQSSGFDFKHVGGLPKAHGHIDFAQRKRLGEDFDSTYAPGSGAMFSTASDLYRFYLALMQEQIISKQTLDMAFTPRKGSYGSGWFNERKIGGRQWISHGGGVPGFIANMQFNDEENLLIIMLSNDVKRDIFTDSDRIAAMILRTQ